MESERLDQLRMQQEILRDEARLHTRSNDALLWCSGVRGSCGGGEESRQDGDADSPKQQRPPWHPLPALCRGRDCRSTPWWWLSRTCRSRKKTWLSPGRPRPFALAFQASLLGTLPASTQAPECASRDYDSDPDYCSTEISAAFDQ